MRSGIRMLLDAEDGFEVVAEAGDVLATFQAVRGHGPDVLVLDLNMPGGSSIEAIKEARTDVPEHVGGGADDGRGPGLVRVDASWR